ncbi:hypothetical protein [Caballeronia sp. LZ001]|nr:hypothetical protein [Caballeronia sp. LZ001]MDR5801787.1 hypothetical protein [Caballeronia sp. LZ001]
MDTSANTRVDIERGAHADLQEYLLDEALAETFPASDPISPSHIS